MKVIRALSVKQRSWVNDPRGNPLYYWIDIIPPEPSLEDAIKQASTSIQLIGDSVVWAYIDDDGVRVSYQDIDKDYPVIPNNNNGWEYKPEYDFSFKKKD